MAHLSMAGALPGQSDTTQTSAKSKNSSKAVPRMGVPTLGSLSRRVVRANIDQVQYMPRDLVWWKAKEFLVLVKKPEQLAFIEETSPHIIEYSDCLWEPFLRKNFTKRFNKFIKDLKKEQGTDDPVLSSSWRELYYQWWEEDKIKEAQDIAMMEQSAEQRAQAQVAKLARVVSPLAFRSIQKGVRMTGSSFDRAYAPRAKNAVQAAKRAAKEESRRRSLAQTWVRTGAKGPASIRRVPRGLAEEVRISKQPKFIPRAAKPQLAPSPADQERARREARLLAAKQTPASAAHEFHVSQSQTVPVRGGPRSSITGPSTTTPKNTRTPAFQTTTDLLFPGTSLARNQQKVITKQPTTASGAGSKSTTSTPSNAPTAPLSTSASRLSQRYMRASPPRDRPPPRPASPTKSRADPLTPAKRPAPALDTTAAGASSSAGSPPTGNGPGSPPGAGVPRKRKKVDVFMPKKRI